MSTRIQYQLLQAGFEEISNQIRIIIKSSNEHGYEGNLNKIVEEARSANTQLELSIQKNMELTAKRMALKRLTDEVTKDIEAEQQIADKFAQMREQVQANLTELVTIYEEFVLDLADKFRNVSKFYAPIEMRIKINEGKKLIPELEDELKQRESTFKTVLEQYENMTISVPEDILDIVGKKELEEKLQQLTEKHDDIIKKINDFKLVK